MARPLAGAARAGPAHRPAPPALHRARRARLRPRRRTALTSDSAPPDAATAYRALAPAVLGYLRAQRAPEPEDLLGEVFLQVARDVNKFSGDDTAFRRWVFSIAHNRLIDARRRAKRRPQPADAEVPDVAAAPPEEPFDPALVAALDTLTPDQREVVVLRFVADLPLEAVAKIVGRNVGSVKALQHRGVAGLARALGVSPEA